MCGDAMRRNGSLPSMSHCTWLAPTVGALGLDLRSGLQVLHDARFRAVQLPLSGLGRIVPRSFGTSARRDLATTLRRLELFGAGCDCWIPPEHWGASDSVDRAQAAVADACVMARDVGALCVCVRLPGQIDPGVSAALQAAADSNGVQLADFGIPVNKGFAVGLDPAAILAEGEDPIARAAEGAASARLTDMAQGHRCVPGADGGRLDLRAYRAAVHVGGCQMPLALDLAGLHEPGVAMLQAAVHWQSIGSEWGG
jgi:hypothetical protein